MSKTRTRIGSLLLAVLMLLSLLPVSALAADTSVADETELRTAIENAQSGDTITLSQDVEITNSIVISTPITLNLGGHTITIQKNAEQTGNVGISFNNSGENVLCNGVVLDERSAGNQDGNFIAVYSTGGGNLTTRNVEISSYQPDNTTSYNYQLRVQGASGTLTLDSGTKITEREQAFPSADQTYGTVGVTILGTAATAQDTYENELNLIINDGVTINTMGFAISGNGSGCNGTNIVINGGTITSTDSLGIYHPQHGTLTINGGTITGKTGIEMRAGNLIVENGANIEGTGETVSVDPNGNGSTSSGVGIAVAQHTTQFPINVTVRGGSIQGVSALYQANPQQNSNDAVEKVELHVAGGSLTTTSDDKNATAVYSENKSDFITGGTFNTSVNSYVAESSKMETSSDASGDYTVTPLTADDEESVAKIGDTYYKSLQGAIDDAADGATIQLLKNITVSVPEGYTAE